METQVENHKKQRKTAENVQIPRQGALFGLAGGDFSLFHPHGVPRVPEWVDRGLIGGGIGTPREGIGIPGGRSRD